MNELTTTRLVLRPLTYAHLSTAIHNPDTLARQLALTIAPNLAYPAIHKALQVKVRKMRRVAAERHLWYTYWLMILPREATAVGLLGYKGEPNEQGWVEIGYGMAPLYAGQGFATEAVTALVAWALAQSVCHGVRAITRADNLASQRVLQKVGFSLVSEQKDDIIWERR